MTPVAALRRRWRTLTASIEGKDRNALSDQYWSRFHDIIDKAATLDAHALEAEIRLQYCLLKLHLLPDPNLHTELKSHLDRVLALPNALDAPLLKRLSLHVQAILHLAAGETTLAEEVRAQLWDLRSPLQRLGEERIAFDDHWNRVSAKAQKPVAVEGLELAEWLFSTSPMVRRDAIRKDDMFAIGGYVTNDRAFYARIGGLERELKAKLAAGFGKPENFVLRGDPGSGKSFLLEQLSGRLELPLVQHNLSSYPTIEAAISAILPEVISTLLSKEKALLFIDEADTSLAGVKLFQGFIAAMNGEAFIHMHNKFSFSKKNLVIFYAMSSEEKKWRTLPQQAPQKWTDFVERVPADHWIEPPAINSSAGERVFRAIGLLNGMARHVKHVDANALFYIGWKNWKSTRELELALRSAVSKISPGSDTLSLSHICQSPTAVDEIEDDGPTRGLLDELGANGKSLWTFGSDHKIQIGP